MICTVCLSIFSQEFNYGYSYQYDLRKFVEIETHMPDKIFQKNQYPDKHIAGSSTMSDS